MRIRVSWEWKGIQVHHTVTVSGWVVESLEVSWSARKFGGGSLVIGRIMRLVESYRVSRD